MDYKNMDQQMFLQKIVAEMPPRVYDSSIYVSEIVDEETENVKSYEIVNISNEGSNDSLCIYIKRY